MKRATDGRKAAKTKGVMMGRPPVPTRHHAQERDSDDCNSFWRPTTAMASPFCRTLTHITCCRRLAEAGCSTHEIMSISGHVTLREVERYTKAANRAKLADSAIAALQSARKGEVVSAKRDSGLANTHAYASQCELQVIDFAGNSKKGWSDASHIHNVVH